MSELLESFTTNVDAFARHQGFADSARSMSDRFSAEAIENVASEHEAKAVEVATDLVMLTADVETRIAELQMEKNDILEGHGDIQMAIEELDLRLAIEEINQDDYEAEKATHEASMADDLEKVKGLDEELDPLSSEYDRWNTLGHEAGILVN
jgi:multidrug resistance efflux pump